MVLRGRSAEGGVKRDRKKRRKRCCKWMLAATFRSCFGTCFKRFGAPQGYDSIEGSSGNNGNRSANGNHGNRSRNGNRRLSRNLSQQSIRLQVKDGCGSECESQSLCSEIVNKSNLDYRSRSTGEIYRGADEMNFTPDYEKSDKRCFSVSFGYLNDRDLFESLSEGMRETLNSAADLRSDVSDAFWSCRGSVFNGSDEDLYYSDSSDDIEGQGFTRVSVCVGCGMAGKEHNFDDRDKDRWRERIPRARLSPPKNAKWVQLS